MSISIPIFIPRFEEQDESKICPNHRTRPQYKFIECPDHNLCLSCSYFSIKVGSCIVCDRNLTDEEKSNKSSIKFLCFKCENFCNGKKTICNCHLCDTCTDKISKSEFCKICNVKNKKLQKNSCDICNQHNIAKNNIINLDCGHNYCCECLEKEVFEFSFERKFELQEIKGLPCLICQKIINDSIIKNHIYHDTFQNYILIKDSKLQCLSCNSFCIDREGFLVCSECNQIFCGTCFMPYDSCSCPSLGQEMNSCEICLRPANRQAMKTLNCEHFFCINCITNYILVKIKESPGEIRKKKEITCLSCDQSIDIHIIKSLLNNKYFNKFTELQIEFNQCPSCQLPYFSEEKNIFCTQCFYEFCNACLKSVQNCDCNNRQEIEYEGLSSCPGCKTLYEKDKNCFNVKCLREDCLAEFCFMCSAYKGPISAHGCHYHRQQCKFYCEYKGNDVVFNESCFACVKAGKLCEPPMNLRVMRRFGENEV